MSLTRGAARRAWCGVQVAHKLTALEERETRTRKHNSLIVKLVLFQFWNNFMSVRPHLWLCCAPSRS